MKPKECLYFDSIYPNIKPYIEPKKKPYFTGDFNRDLFQFTNIENIPIMIINQKSEKAFYIMKCNEKGVIIDPYAVINKRFSTKEKAIQFFNKYVRNVKLIITDITE